MTMRLYLVLALAPACTGISSDPDPPPPPQPPPELIATSSAERATSDIYMKVVAISEASAGMTSLRVTALDRLVDRMSVQLVDADHLVASIGGTSYPLDEELVDNTFHSSRTPQYVVSIPVGDPRTISLDFVRADTTLHSTIQVPAAYTIDGGIPPNIKMSSIIDAQLSPPGPTLGELNWACADSSRELPAFRREAGVTANDAGAAVLFVEEPWDDYNDPDHIAVDCDGWFAIFLEAKGSWADEFANSPDDAPVGYQTLRSDVHLWP